MHVCIVCTPGRDRTGTFLRTIDFESIAATCYATGMCFGSWRFTTVRPWNDIYKKDYKLMPNRDSNTDKRNQNPLRYRYAIGQFLLIFNLYIVGATIIRV